MHVIRTPAVAVLGLLLAVGTPRAAVRQSATDRPDFTGAWKINQELTQRPERPDENGSGVSHRGGGGGGRTPGGGGGGGMGGMGGGRRGPGGMGGGGYGGGGGQNHANTEEMAKVREAMRQAMLIPDGLTIVKAYNGFTITDNDGVSFTLTADGKSVKSEVGAVKVETKAKWEEAVLVVERKFDGGVKATDRYWVTDAPRQLVVASKVENSRMRADHAIALQRVYDFAETHVP
jgi:hypothetical protein